MVASALGRCLALAAVGEAPLSLEQAVIPVPDPEFDQVMPLALTPWLFLRLCRLDNCLTLLTCLCPDVQHNVIVNGHQLTATSS